MDLVYVIYTESGHVDKHWHIDCLPKYLLTHRRLGMVKYREDGYGVRDLRCEVCQNSVIEPRRVLKW